MAIKIFGGELAGRTLETPRTAGVRPLSARVKRTLFDLLGDAVVGARVADLFAGTGSFAFEALSRGAAETVLVENEAALVDLIYKNARRLGLSDVINAYEGDVLDYLVSTRPTRAYDIIFADPPYGSELLGPVLERLSKWSGARAGSVLVLRVFKKENVRVVFPWEPRLERVVGDDKLIFLAFAGR